MPKRLLIGLILLIAILVSLYQLRTQLLTTAFNTALAKADIRLLQIDGLEMGWHGVDIDRLVLGVGKDGAPQSLQGLHMAYSVIDIQPHSLTVKRAVLTVPDSNDDQADDSTALLADVLDQVMSGTLQFVRVDAMELDGFSSRVLNFPLSLLINWEEDTVSLNLADQDNTLLLQLRSPLAGKQSLLVNLTQSGSPVLELATTLTQEKSRHFITGEGSLWLDATLPLLSKMTDVSGLLNTASGELLFVLSGELDDNLKKIHAQSWQVELLPRSTAALEIDNTQVQVNAQLSFPQGLVVSMEVGAAQDIALSLAGSEISWQLQEQSNLIKATGQLSDVACQYQSLVDCQAGFHVQVGAPQLTVPGDQSTVAQQLTLSLFGQLTLDNDQLSAVVEPGEWLWAQSLTQGDMVFEGPALAAGSVGTFNYKLSTAELELDVSELQLGLPQVQMPDMNLATLISLQGLDLSRDASGVITGGAHLATDAINLQRPDSWLPAPALDFDIVIAGQRVSAKGVLLGGGHRPLFDVDMTHALDTGRGAAQLVAHSLEFDAIDNRLSRHFAYWPFDWDIFEGELEIDLGLRWENGEQGTEIRGEIKQQLRSVAGVYQDIGFIGLDAAFAVKFQSPDQFISSSPAVISLQSLDVGVPIEAIELSFLLNAARQEVLLESLEARIFGGRVWIEDANYQADRDHNPIYIGVDGMQLDKLLELAGYDAIQGTGTISGLLPLDVNKAGITMERGMLAAKAPGGVFRYHAEIVAGTNPAMVQVIEALNNYHYSVFQVEADYMENGDLVLAMLLRGSNPGLQQGRPIHLNLNVTDNIPTLLKSLQSGRVIADTVSKKLGGKAN